MRLEVFILVIFLILLVFFCIIYFFGEKIKARLFKKKDKKKTLENAGAKEEKTEKPKPKVTAKVERPILLSPTPDVKVKETQEKRTVSKSDIDEIRKFIEDNADGQKPLLRPGATTTRQALSDYNKVEDFGDIIDIDEEDYYPTTPSYEPRHSSGESEFLKNRGDDKKLYEELKNMSPEMKKIIMADILRRRNN